MILVRISGFMNCLELYPAERSTTSIITLTVMSTVSISVQTLELSRKWPGGPSTACPHCGLTVSAHACQLQGSSCAAFSVAPAEREKCFWRNELAFSHGPALPCWLLPPHAFAQAVPLFLPHKGCPAPGCPIACPSGPRLGCASLRPCSLWASLCHSEHSPASGHPDSCLEGPALPALREGSTAHRTTTCDKIQFAEQVPHAHRAAPRTPPGQRFGWGFWSLLMVESSMLRALWEAWLVLSMGRLNRTPQLPFPYKSHLLEVSLSSRGAL